MSGLAASGAAHDLKRAREGEGERRVDSRRWVVEVSSVGWWRYDGCLSRKMDARGRGGG